MMADDSTLLSGVSELDVIPPQSQTLTERLLNSGSSRPTHKRVTSYNGRETAPIVTFSSRIFFAFLLQRQALPVICSKLTWELIMELTTRTLPAQTHCAGCARSLQKDADELG
jgi:hypothetical protein